MKTIAEGLTASFNEGPEVVKEVVGGWRLLTEEDQWAWKDDIQWLFRAIENHVLEGSIDRASIEQGQTNWILLNSYMQPVMGIDPGETPDQALVRELKEETGITALSFHNIYERGEETADGRMSRTYYVDIYEGEPKTNEEGIFVSWENFSRLLEDNCSFREYNRNLLHSILVS